MERDELLKVLKVYETPVVASVGSAGEKEGVRVLVNDINRIDLGFSRWHLHSARVRLYKNILLELLSDFPLKYIQGMAEVACVIVDAYFQEAVGEFRLEGLDGSPALSITNSGSPTFVYKEADEQEMFATFIEKYKSLIGRARSALANILEKKFMALVSNRFKLYKESNDVFIAMMKQRGIKIKKETSLQYMNHVLTFFERIFDNERVAFSVYKIILSSEPTVLFSILVLLYEHVQSSLSANVEAKKLEKLPASFEKSVALEQIAFVETREKLAEKGFGIKKFLFFGAAAASLVAVAAAYQYNRK